MEGWNCILDQCLFIDLCPVIILIDVFWCIAHPPQVFSLTGLLPLWTFSSVFYSTLLRVVAELQAWGKPCLIESNRILVVDVKAAEQPRASLYKNRMLISFLKVPVWLNIPAHVCVQMSLEASSLLTFNCLYLLCAFLACTLLLLKIRQDQKSTFEGADVSLKMFPDFTIKVFFPHHQHRNWGSRDKAAAPST